MRVSNGGFAKVSDRISKQDGDTINHSSGVTDQVEAEDKISKPSTDFPEYKINNWPNIAIDYNATKGEAIDFKDILDGV